MDLTNIRVKESLLWIETHDRVKKSRSIAGLKNEF